MVDSKSALQTFGAEYSYSDGHLYIPREIQTYRNIYIFIFFRTNLSFFLVHARHGFNTLGAIAIKLKDLLVVAVPYI